MEMRHISMNKCIRWFFTEIPSNGSKIKTDNGRLSFFQINEIIFSFLNTSFCYCGKQYNTDNVYFLKKIFYTTI